MGQRSMDTWGAEMRSFFKNHDILSTFDTDRVNLRRNPYLGHLGLAFHAFARAFITSNGNFRDQHIFDNLIYKVLNLNFHTLTMSDLTLPTRVTNRNKLLNLKFGDMIGLRLYDADYVTFKENTEIELTYDEYKFLVEKTRLVINKFKNKLNFPTTPLDRYCKRKNMKSRDFRKFLEPQRNFTSCAPSRSRALWASSTLSQERENAFYNTWNLSFLPINVRDFAFKFLNSKLYLNGQISHLPNQDNIGSCTFCTLNGIQNRETYEHFFINCNTVKNIMREYFVLFLNSKDFDWDQKMCLIGTDYNLFKNDVFITNLEIITALFYIANCRSKKTLPNIVQLEQHMHNYREIYRLSNRYNRSWLKWEGVQAPPPLVNWRI